MSTKTTTTKAPAPATFTKKGVTARVYYAGKRWVARYSREQRALDDSSRPWHPEMPTDPKHRAKAVAIARKYASGLA